MIEGFRHKGLRLLFESDDRSKVPAAQADKIAGILARLDEATDVRDIDLPGYRLHPLKGKLKDFWAVSVSGTDALFFASRAEEHSQWT